MKRLLILAAFGTALGTASFAVPAIADSQFDLSTVEAQLQNARLDANSAAIVEGLEDSAATALSKNDPSDATLDINQLEKYVPMHHHMTR